MARGRPNIKATQEQIEALRVRMEALASDATSVGELVRHYSDAGLITLNTLQRFLTGCNGKVDAAEKKLLEHLTWRREFKVDSILEEDFSTMAMEQDEEMAWRGLDNDGHPILHWRPRLHDPSQYPYDVQARYIVYKLEQGLKMFAPAEQFVTVIDCRGLSRRNVNFPMIKAIAPVIEQNYPERQFAAYVVPVSTLVNLVWKFIGAFLDAGTIFKYRLLTSFDEEAMTINFDLNLIQLFKEGVLQTSLGATDSHQREDRMSESTVNLFLSPLSSDNKAERQDKMHVSPSLSTPTNLLFQGLVFSNPIGGLHEQADTLPWHWLRVFVCIYKVEEHNCLCVCLYNSITDRSKAFCKYYQCCKVSFDESSDHTYIPHQMHICLWMRGDNHRHTHSVLNGLVKQNVSPTSHAHTLHFAFVDDEERHFWAKEFSKSIKQMVLRPSLGSTSKPAVLADPPSPLDGIGGDENVCVCTYDIYEHFLSRLGRETEQGTIMQEVCESYDKLCEEISEADRPKHLRKRANVHGTENVDSLIQPKQRWKKLFQFAQEHSVPTDTQSEHRSVHESEQETKSDVGTPAPERPKKRSMWRRDKRTQADETEKAAAQQAPHELDRLRLAFTRELTANSKLRACTRSLAGSLAQQLRETQELRQVVEAQARLLRTLTETCSRAQQDAKAYELACLASIEMGTIRSTLHRRTFEDLQTPMGEHLELDGVSLLNRNKVCMSKVDDAMGLAQGLLETLTEIVADEGTESLHEADDLADNTQMSIASSGRFKDFCLDTAELQRVDVSSFSGDISHRFFLCVYNLMSLHASFALGIPLTQVVGKYASLVAYDIGGDIYSLSRLSQMLA